MQHQLIATAASICCKSPLRKARWWRTTTITKNKQAEAQTLTSIYDGNLKYDIWKYSPLVQLRFMSSLLLLLHSNTFFSKRKTQKLTYLVSESDVHLSNTIFQHFILLQYAILLLIVSCKDDCVLESVRPKTVELMLNLIVFKKNKTKKIENKKRRRRRGTISLERWKCVRCLFLFIFVCVLSANSGCCWRISPSQCVCFA